MKQKKSSERNESIVGNMYVALSSYVSKVESQLAFSSQSVIDEEGRTPMKLLRTKCGWVL